MNLFFLNFPLSGSNFISTMGASWVEMPLFGISYRRVRGWAYRKRFSIFEKFKTHPSIRKWIKNNPFSTQDASLFHFRNLGTIKNARNSVEKYLTLSTFLAFTFSYGDTRTKFSPEKNRQFDYYCVANLHAISKVKWSLFQHNRWSQFCTNKHPMVRGCRHYYGRTSAR